MADETTRVLGLGETINNLKRLEEKLVSNIIRRASRAAGNVYLKDIKSGAYGAGRTQRTGLLARSPGVAVSRKPGGIISGRVKMRPLNIGGKTKFAKGVRKARGRSIGLALTYAAFYWKFLEFGVSKQRKTKSGAARGALSARPWVRPIFQTDSDTAIEAYRIVVEKAVTEEAAKLPQTNRR